MAIKIKKHIFGGWSYYDDKAKARGIIYANEEKQVLKLEDVQGMSVGQIDALHSNTVGQTKLDAIIDSKVDEYFKQSPNFPERDYVLMLEDCLSTKVFVKDGKGAERYKGVEDFMQPDVLARYLSTFSNKIKAQFEQKIKGAPNYHTRFAIEKVVPKFLKITEAQMVVFEKGLFENQLSTLLKMQEKLLASHKDKSEKNAELEAEIKRIKGEIDKITPEVEKAEKVLAAALGKSATQLRSMATKHTEKVAELEQQIADYEQKIAKLDLSIAENSDTLKVYQNEILKLKNELARLKAQTKGFEEPGPTP